MSSFSVDSRRPRPWCRAGPDGSLTLTVRVQPGAKRNQVVGVHGDCLKIRLAAPAIEGKANTALKTFLADAFAVPERAVTLVHGASGRRKIVHVATPGRRPEWEWVE